MAPKFFFHEPTKKSNLIVYALGKKYFLHKLFLEESPYFIQLINEMKGNELRLRITDQLITLECKILIVNDGMTIISDKNHSFSAIDFVFCYIYQADVELNNNVTDVAAILATAAFFKFDTLFHLASKKVMTLCNIKNVSNFN